jgi:hypothetical protein
MSAGVVLGLEKARHGAQLPAGDLLGLPLDGDNWSEPGRERLPLEVFPQPQEGARQVEGILAVAAPGEVIGRAPIAAFHV